MSRTPGGRLALAHRAGRMFAAVILALFAAIPAFCSEPVRIGVLAYRPKEVMLAQWLPVAAELKKAIPEREFEVEALTYPEIKERVDGDRLDFLFTNPGLYIQLRKSGKLSSPLATLAVNDGGNRLSQMGGVIVALAERKDISGLSDLAGKTIATPGLESLGGYQTQAFELSKAGVSLPADAKLLVTGMPHDNVLVALLEGNADAGFVRNGVVEAAVREGKLDPAKLKFINLRGHPGFPHKISTALYPEWPFSAFVKTDEKLARRVSAALLLIDEKTLAESGSEIYGFSVPTDYNAVEAMLRELRLPPFDAAPEFTLLDVWERYRRQGVTALAAVAVIALLGVWLVFLALRLKKERTHSVQQAEKLRESEARLLTLIETEPECVKQLDAEGKLLYMNRAGLDMIEADTFAQVSGVEAALIVTEEYREAFREVVRKVFAGESATLVFETQGLKGGRHWLETHSVPMRDAKGEVISLLSITRDITERVNAEREREAALAHIKKLEGILPICMYCKKIRDKDDSWDVLEHYISKKTDAQFSHGICPTCLERVEKEVD